VIPKRVIGPEVWTALAGVAARFASEPRCLVDEATLLKRYAALEAWPADAQLGLVVLAWTLGSGFSLKGFAQAVNQLVPDYEAAARAIGPGKNPVAITIGEIARVCFFNASLVVRFDLKDTGLYWPTDLSKSVGSGILR
jgi:hypothetical protein